jgi:hypothetical protein
LIENLRGNASWRQLCGWEYPSQKPSEPTFYRVFKEFTKLNLLDEIHDKDKLVGYVSSDLTTINGRKKSYRKNTAKKECKKKRGRKSKAELAAMKEQELAEVKNRKLELKPNHSLS